MRIPATDRRAVILNRRAVTDRQAVNSDRLAVNPVFPETRRRAHRPQSSSSSHEPRPVEQHATEAESGSGRTIGYPETSALGAASEGTGELSAQPRAIGRATAANTDRQAAKIRLMARLIMNRLTAKMIITTHMQTMLSQLRLVDTVTSMVESQQASMVAQAHPT